MAIISDMGVDGTGMDQPKLKNRFRITFLGGGFGDAQPLRLNAVTADRYKLQFNEVIVDRYNSRAYVAGKHEFQPINITFEDTVDGLVKDALENQQELQQQITGIGSAPGLPAAPGGQVYKFSTIVEILDGSLTGVLETNIHEGCFLQNIDMTDLDYGASEQVRIVATIRFDHARTQQSGFRMSALGGSGN